MIFQGPFISRSATSCFGDVFTSVAGLMRSRVVAKVTADKGEAGIKIVASTLQVTVTGLEGMDAATFAEVAREAEGKCPVSNALRGSLRIDVEPTVA